ncbi:hypothetical protein BDP55DRAFT_282237 [Colletotrichum godetiae]|uniref:Uncharacterized protein n=1 Tax=Colletotrichum godetiae TaxID=1209918 RepID=A0AAJ0ADN7_9PEZI|nr:uncharacterized protein BDP55DRAFT_282237 [Colletotrichum godetiae]KAK1671966.1 hypothetical protein BDP55DRAFT_282237 [Colletotrichum godetiae]
MCCRRRRAARQAWLEQRGLGGPRGCHGARHFGPGPGGPPFRPPWASGGGGGGPPFGRWRDIPRDSVPQDPFRDPPAAPRNDPATRDPEKGAVEMNFRDVEKSTPAPTPAPAPTAAPAPEGDSKRVSFMSGPFSRWRESVRSGGGDVRRSSSNATLPPRYTSGVTEAPYWSGEQAGNRGSMPPNYDVAIKN